MEENLYTPSILNNKVSLTNLATRAAHGFTLREKRLFSCGISKLNTLKKFKSVSIEDRTFKVVATEYAEVSGLSDPLDAYRDMKAAARNMRKRYIKYSVQTPKGLKVREFNWLSSITYHEGEGWVSFTLSDEILPHVFNLARNFTSYRLRQASELRSVYSWRLLELLTSWTSNQDKQHIKTADLEELRHSLELPKSYKYKDIRVRVIEPAVKELTQKDGWKIKWTGLKKGRSFVAIKFDFMRDEQKDLFHD